MHNNNSLGTEYHSIPHPPHHTFGLQESETNTETLEMRQWNRRGFTRVTEPARNNKDASCCVFGLNRTLNEGLCNASVSNTLERTGAESVKWSLYEDILYCWRRVQKHLIRLLDLGLLESRQSVSERDPMFCQAYKYGLVCLRVGLY